MRHTVTAGIELVLLATLVMIPWGHAGAVELGEPNGPDVAQGARRPLMSRDVEDLKASPYEHLPPGLSPAERELLQG